MSRLTRSLSVTLALALPLGMAAPTIGETTHFSDDFESYDTGAGSSVALPNTGLWSYTTQTGINYSVVDSTVVTPPSGGGGQALRFERTAGSAGDRTLRGNFSTALTIASGSSVRFSFDALRASRNAADNSPGDGFVFIASDTASATNFGAQIDVMNNGNVRYRDGVTGDYASVEDVIDAGTWYRYEIVLNVSEANKITYDFSLTPAGGVSQVIASDVPANSGFAVGDQVRINLSPRSDNTLMYFDNFTVTSVIPEPSSVTLLGLGGALMLFRNRR